MNEVTHTLTLRALSAQAIDDAMIQALTARGYRVVPAPDRLGSEWETPGELARRVGLHAGSLRRTLRRKSCPLPSDIETGPSGGIIAFRSNPALDAFLCGAAARGRSPR